MMLVTSSFRYRPVINSGDSATLAGRDRFERRTLSFQRSEPKADSDCHAMGLKLKAMGRRRRTVCSSSATVLGTDSTPVTFLSSKQHRFIFHEPEEMVCDKQPYSNDALQGKPRKSVGFENAVGALCLAVQSQNRES